MAKKKADAGEGENAAAEEGKPAGGKKKLIMIAAAVLVLAGGGGGFFFWKKKQASADTAGKPEVRKTVAFVDIPEMTINLSGGAQERQHFLKVKIALEVGDPKMIPEINPVMPRVLDTFQVYLREMRASDLEGSAAMYRLKEELMRRVNVAVYPAKIEAVLLKEALIQ